MKYGLVFVSKLWSVRTTFFLNDHLLHWTLLFRGETSGNTEDLMWYNLLWTTNECQEMDRRQDSVHYMSQHVSAHTEGKRIFIINKLVVRREQWILSLLKSLERVSKRKSPILPNVWCKGVQYIFYWKQSHLCSHVVSEGSINKG